MSKKKKAARPVALWIEALSMGTAPENAPEGWAIAEAWLADGSGSLETLDGRLALSVVEAAGDAGEVERLQGLEDSPDKALRKAGRRALHRLRSAGLSVNEPPRSNVFSLQAEVVDIPSRAFLGHAHQEGYAPFLLTATDSEGSCILAGEIGGGEGARNTTHLHVTRRDLRDVWKDAEANPDMVEVSLVTGLHFVKRAMDVARTLAGRSPHDWDHFLGHISQGTQTTAQLWNPGEGLSTELDESLLEGLDEGHLLAERSWFRFWPVPEEAISALFEDLGSAAASDLTVSEEVQAERREDAFRKAADRALEDDTVRQRWLTSMENSVAVLRAGGKEEAAAEVHNLALAIRAGLPGRRLAPVLASLRFQTFKLASMMGQMDGMEEPPTP